MSSSPRLFGRINRPKPIENEILVASMRPQPPCFRNAWHRLDWCYWQNWRRRKQNLQSRRAQSGIPIWFGPTNFIQNTIVPNLVSQVSSEVTTPAPATNNVLPQTTSAVSTTPVSGFPIAAKSNILGIGLMWGANADVDLHVLPNKSARELYYGYTQSKWGRYGHDFRSANEGIGFEYCELKTPVDIRDVKCYANYYSGNAWPICGRVVVFFNGFTYYGEFSLAAHHCNRGFDSNSRDSSLYWTKIDLLTIVGLNRPTQTANASQ